MLQYIPFIIKNILVVEAWNSKGDQQGSPVHTIDNFTITLYDSFDNLDQSNSRILQGESGIANLTVRIRNLTAEKGECSFK